MNEFADAKTISLGDSSAIVIDPDVLEARELRDWWFGVDLS